MATTETLRFTGTELPPSLTHRATRRHLLRDGLPRGRGHLFTFGPPRAVPAWPGPPPDATAGAVPAAGGAPAEAGHPRGERVAPWHPAGEEGRPPGAGDAPLVVIGELREHGPGFLVVLDGATGVPYLAPRPVRPDPFRSGTVRYGVRDPAPAEPLAPDLPTLLRFERAVREAAEPPDPYGTPGGREGARYGPSAAAESRDGLLALFREGLDGAPVPVFWRIAALIRPLARVPAPGLHLRLDLPGRLLADEFGAGAVARCEDADLPAALTHEPTRRFLGDIGLPEREGPYVSARQPLRTLADHHGRVHPVTGDPDGLPPGAARLVPIGHLTPDTDVVVDGPTGEVLSWHWHDPGPLPLSADVSTLAFTTWLCHRARYLDEAEDRRLTTPARSLLSDAVRAVLKATDPVSARSPVTVWTDPSRRRTPYRTGRGAALHRSSGPRTPVGAWG
ncbi:SUKH-4 family immunity protein [Streptomyces sp. JNUCC 64]